MKKINNYWVDDNNNKWNCDITEEKAIKNSNTLINCSYCAHCVHCSDCSDCSYCSGCSDCSDCSDCSNCYDCYNCSDCSNCYDCSDCHNCSYCYDCSHCHDCHNCSNCAYCSYCSNFTENPQRYLSKRIGSRNQQTMFYWTKQDKNLIVCGCFKNTLIEFEQRVKEIHGDNDYGKQYQEFIDTCKLLMEK